MLAARRTRRRARQGSSVVPRNHAEIEPQNEHHQADDEHESQIVESHDDAFAHRAAHQAFEDQKHHVAAIEQRNRQEIDHRQVGA